MDAPLLRAVGLGKTYLGGSPFSRRRVTALLGVDLVLAPGRTLAVIGESGSGKSTLARCLARLEAPSAGQIWFEGVDLARLSARQLYPHRPKIQIVFQDPVSSLNPRLSAIDVVAEPLVVRRWGTSRERRERALSLIEQVGLPPQDADRGVLEWSGGQRQRLALARALILEPRLLILDEPLSALDLPVQAQLADLLLDLQARRGLACLFVSHDLSRAAHLAHEVAVMEAGRIVESGPTHQVLRDPQHPKTRALLQAVPRLPGRAPA